MGESSARFSVAKKRSLPVEDEDIPAFTPLPAYGFRPISVDNFHEASVKEMNMIRARARILPPVVPPSRGGPRKTLDYTDVSVTEISSDSDSDCHVTVVRKGRGKRPTTQVRPTHYKNWFIPEDWPLIFSALQSHQFKVRAAVTYLKARYKNLGLGGQFYNLKESTIRRWFERDGRTLTKKVRLAVNALAVSEHTARVMRPGGDGIWTGNLELEGEFVKLMVELREGDVGLNSLLIQFHMKAFLRLKCPDLLHDVGGRFRISRRFIRAWVRKRLQWSFRRPTGDCNKLPADWEKKGRRLCLQIAYLVLTYNIPMELVVNADQTGLQLMPLGDERTYTTIGAGELRVAGRGDKREVTLMVSASASGSLLPFQVIFEGTKYAEIPIGPSAALLKYNGFHLTCTSKHWSSVESMKDYVTVIFLPWHTKQCNVLNLDPSQQKAILIIDCYSVHRSEAFTNWMAAEHPNIFLLWIPSYCTCKLQPCDVVVQRPVKCAVQRCFETYVVTTIQNQMAAGLSAEACKLDTQISFLRNKLCAWLWTAYAEVGRRADKIFSGWTKIGLIKAWDEDTQSDRTCDAIFVF